jgi:hypothetical protein
MHRPSTSGCGISLYTPGVIPEELREQFGNACELVCIQVPKVYDSCLLRQCLVGDKDKENLSEGIIFDSDLCKEITPPPQCDRVAGIVNARVKKLRNFKVIQKKCVPGDPDRKIITFTYELVIVFDIVNDRGRVFKNNRTVLKRTETVGPLYCPESLAIIREVEIDDPKDLPVSGNDVDDEIIKVEIVARVLDAVVDEDSCDPYDDECFAVFTVGLYIIIKCELVVQLVVPAFGFCPPPAPCERIGEPCEIFNAQLPPAFFPPQLDEFISGPGIDC